MRTLIVATSAALAALVALPSAAARAAGTSAPATDRQAPVATVAPTPASAAAPAPAPTSDPPPAPQTSVTTIEDERGIVDDDGYRVSLSLPTEDDRTAWLEPGLRIELAIASGTLLGRGPSPRLGLTSFLLRPRLRLDRYWSLAATFGYAVANGDYTGMRWSGLIEPVFHPLPALGISFGLGVGGLGVANPSVGLPSLGQQEISTRTLGDDERIMDCSGEGWASVARLEYLFVVGPLFSTGPYAVADAQWTRCEETLGGVDRETGKATLGRQWWLNAGGSIGWWFSWR